MEKYSVQVKTVEIKEEMRYHDTVVLSYKIEYPQFSSEKFTISVKKINKYYEIKALAFEKYCRTKLYQMAVELYLDSIANHFPVHRFEAVLAYELTLNQNCTISLYFDRYEYTGGAHGNTIRYSDTWNLQNGLQIPLSQMFRRPINYRAYIINTVNNQIEEQLQENPGIYFEDYKENVNNTFNEENFYLTDKGIIIYFQQYDIAPYSTGIPEFTIPHSDGKVIRPRCRV